VSTDFRLFAKPPPSSGSGGVSRGRTRAAANQSYSSPYVRRNGAFMVARSIGLIGSVQKNREMQIYADIWSHCVHLPIPVHWLQYN